MDQEQPQHNIFTVDDKPYCLWDWELSERTLTFLDGYDPDYFVYLADVHRHALDTDQQQYAALALRASHAQALETLFAFLCAAVQAPFAVPAWLAKYQNNDLLSIVSKINGKTVIYSADGKKRYSWNDISALIHIHIVIEDKTKEAAIKAGYAVLWQRLANNFLNEDNKREYNSVKHGFRARPGGSTFAFGLESQPGIPASIDNMRVLGSSSFGSTFMIPEHVFSDKEDRHHLYLKRQMLNWHPEDMIMGLKLIASSLKNIVSYLKIINGVAALDVNFAWPASLEDFQTPWRRQRTMGMANMTWTDSSFMEHYAIKYTKAELLSIYDTLAKSSNTEEN